MKTEVNLEDEHLLLLDGRVDEETQRVIDKVKNRIRIAAENGSLTPEQAKFVGDVVSYAKKNGKLRFMHTSLRYCGVCKKSVDYVKFKSGPRKGQSNYKKPINLSGIDLSVSCVSIRGHASLGCCKACFDATKETLMQQLSSVVAEIPKQLRDGDKHYTKFPIRHCKKCGWKGSERLMKRSRTLMGDGFYPSGCPECDAKNVIFGPTIIESTDEFEIYETPTT